MGGKVVVALNRKLISYINLDGFGAKLVALDRLPLRSVDVGGALGSTVDGLGVADNGAISEQTDVDTAVVKMGVYVVDITRLCYLVRR